MLTLCKSNGRNRLDPLAVDRRADGEKAGLSDPVEELLVGAGQIPGVGLSQTFDIVLVAAARKLRKVAKRLVEGAILGVVPLPLERGTLDQEGGEVRIDLAILADKMVKDGAGAGGLAPGADAVAVSSHLLDVLLDPFEEEGLVVEPGVRLPLLLHVGAGQPAEGSEAIVARDEDSSVVRRLEHRLSGVQWAELVFAAEGVGAAVEPYHDRQAAGLLLESRGRDVDV